MLTRPFISLGSRQPNRATQTSIEVITEAIVHLFCSLVECDTILVLKLQAAMFLMHVTIGMNLYGDRFCFDSC